MSTKESNLTNEIHFLDEFLGYCYPENSQERITIYKLFHERAIQVSSVMENVIAAINPDLKVDSTNGRDFNDGSDAKTATVRIGREDTFYGANISDTHNKNGTLRVIVYEMIQHKFYFFLIPFSVYSKYKNGFNIPFCINTGNPQRHVNKFARAVLWECEVPSIEALANFADLPKEILKNTKVKGNGTREEQYKRILDNEVGTNFEDLFTI